MATGRMIHKTISTSETLATVDIQARYMYIGIIIHSDDDGRMKASPAFLKALLFPFDQGVRVETIKNWREQLTASGLISLYAVDGKEYLYHPNWKQWQSIRKDRYNPSDCPQPSNENEMATDWQPNGNQLATQPNLTEPNLTKPKKEYVAKPRFEQPSVEQIREYCKSRKNNVDAQRFYDYYQANGWKVGKNPMKDWQAAVRTWEKNGFNSNQPIDDGIPAEWKTPQPAYRR